MVMYLCSIVREHVTFGRLIVVLFAPNYACDRNESTRIKRMWLGFRDEILIYKFKDYHTGRFKRRLWDGVDAYWVNWTTTAWDRKQWEEDNSGGRPMPYESLRCTQKDRHGRELIEN